jgi:amino acid adenylation domain-containing protein
VTRELTPAPDGDLAARIAALPADRRALLERELAARAAAARPGPAASPGGGGARGDATSRRGPVPLTPGQRQLWLAARLDPVAATYHRLFALRLTGELDARSLRDALGDVVARHDSLRLRLVERDGVPLQEAGPGYEVALPVLRPPAGADEPPAEAVVRFVAEPFDLGAARPLRALLVRYAPTDHSLLLCVHHLVSDSWSDGVLAADLLDRYTARIHGDRASRPALGTGFLDVAAAQASGEATRDVGDGAAGVAFWREQFRTPLPRLGLRGGELPGGRRSGAGGLVRLPVPARLADAVDAFAAVRRVTPFSVWLTAYLWAVRGTVVGAPEPDEVLVTSPSAGRSERAWEQLVGYFVHTLVLRVPLGPAKFTATVDAVHEQLLAIHAHLDTPVEPVLDTLPAATRRSLPAALPLGFAYQNTPAAGLSPPGLDVRVERLDPGAAKTCLTSYVWRDRDVTTLGVEYLAGLFDGPTAEQVGQRLLGVLEDIVTGGDPPAPDGRDEELERLHRRSNLTRAQLVLWLDQQLRPDSPVHTVATEHRFGGDLDPGRFAAALDAVVAESDALRSRIVVTDGVPLSEIAEPRPGRHRFVDLGGLDDAERRTAQMAADLATTSLWAAGRTYDSTLVRLGPQSFAWLFAAHHLAFDGWSQYAMFHRLQEHYRGTATGTVPPYAAAVAAERDRATAPRRAADAAFWAGRLALREEDVRADVTSSPALAGTVGAAAAVAETDLGAERAGRLRAAGAVSGAASADLGVQQLLQAAVAVWWCRVRGTRAAWLGMPLHNRRPAERRTIGLFMAIYPLRVAPRRDATFADVVAAVRAETGAVVRHRARAPRDPLGRRGFDVLVNYQAVGEEAFDEHPYRIRWLHSGTADEAVAVQFSDFAVTGGLRLAVQVNVGLADRLDPGAAADGIVAALDALLCDPSRRVADVDLLTPSQRRRLADLNDTAVPGPRVLVPDLIREAAATAPDRVAVAEGDRRTTYRELLERATALAWRLREQGAGQDRPVAVYGDGGTESVVAVVGALLAGVPYVPLDAGYGPRRLLAVTEQIALAAVVTGQAPAGLSADLPVIDPATPDLPPAVALGPPPVVVAGSVAYVAFTSGSTGRPKGAVVTHDNLANAWVAERHEFGLDPADPAIHLQLASLSFDVYAANIVRALCSAATLVPCPHATKLDPSRLHELIEGERVTHAEFVPAVVRPLVAYLTGTGRRMDSWRLLLVGSDVWTAADQRALAAVCAPGTRFGNSYGLTETTISTTFHELHARADGAAGVRERSAAEGEVSVPIGRPMADQTVYLLDDDLRPVPPGAVGEIHIGGRGVGLGYWGRPDLTATAFVPDPYRRGARMYRTGDLGRLDPDGALAYLGRRDAQVKVRGVRIEPAEVEDRLRRLSSVRDAAVAAFPDRDGRPELAAYVVAGEPPPHADDLRRALAAALPGFPVPAWFLRVDRIALTASGKPDRSALPDPAGCESLPDRPARAARTESEQLVAGIWRDVLDRDRVDADANFFDLGGHSLLLLRMRERLSEATGTEVPVAALFEHPTVSALAAYLTGRPGLAAADRPQRPGAAAAPAMDRGGLLAQRATRAVAGGPGTGGRP